MRFKKSFRKILVAAVTAGTFAIMPLVSAEVREYEGFGEYVMSDFETPDVAKQRAKVRAEQNVMEQAGVYVESYTKVINAQVTHDEIATMTNGILVVKDVQYKMTPTDDGKAFLIHAIIKADIDTADVSKWLEQNKQKMEMLVEQNKALQKAREDQDRKIEELKQHIVNVKTVQDKNEIQEKFTTADQEFLSGQKTEEGHNLIMRRDYIEGVLLLSQAVELNPKNAEAYSLLGWAYGELKEGEKALNNCNKAITIDSDNSLMYNGRGNAYGALGNHTKAIADYTKAIELNPNFPMAYNNRGVEYLELGDYSKAMADFTKSIELNPRNAMEYNNCGLVYVELGDYEKAITNYTKAIELDPQHPDAYINRGFVYDKFGNHAQAIADYTKFIALVPNDAFAYYCRGVAYQNMGNYEKANTDFAKAKSMGFKP